MNPSLLLLISSDPRTSHRPAEAIRIAAGLHASQQIVLTVYLHEAALLTLSEETDDLVDGDDYQRYLPLLAEPAAPIYTLSSNPFTAQLLHPRLPCRWLEPSSLGQLAAACSYLLRF